MCIRDSVNSVQRDYMAGEVSKDITKRLLLPEHIVTVSYTHLDVYKRQLFSRTKKG